jgi:hypothetical protein
MLKNRVDKLEKKLDQYKGYERSFVVFSSGGKMEVKENGRRVYFGTDKGGEEFLDSLDDNYFAVRFNVPPR